MDFAQILSDLMFSRKVTAYQIWKETKIPQSSIGTWKAGTATPSAENITKLAEYFNVTIDYLLGKEGIKNKPGFLPAFVIIAWPLPASQITLLQICTQTGKP